MTEPRHNAQGHFAVNSFEDLGAVLGIMIHDVDSRFNPVDGRFDWIEQKSTPSTAGLDRWEKKADAEIGHPTPRTDRAGGVKPVAMKDIAGARLRLLEATEELEPLLGDSNTNPYNPSLLRVDRFILEARRHLQDDIDRKGPIPPQPA